MKTVIAVAVAIVLAVVIGAGGFFAGTAYGQSQAQDTRAEFFRNRAGGQGQFGQNGQAGQAGQNGQGGQGGQFGRAAAFGTVKSVNGDTLVITQQDGSTVTVTTNA